MERSLVLSVSAGTGCYRHIQINESATLFKLHQTILEAFDFDDDHMHAFFMNNQAWDGNAVFMCPDGDGDYACGFSDKVNLSGFHLLKGDKFLYIFDFGDDWRFQIKVLRVIDKPTQTPVILRSVGHINQYDDGDF